MPESNYLKNKISPATGYFGAKAHLARRIIQFFPEHRVYVEPFAGAMNVILNKYRSPVEVVSDMNAELIHFYRTLVHQTDELLDLIQSIPYSRDSFHKAKNPEPDQDPLTRAANYITIQRMIWSGVGSTWMDDPKRRDAWGRLTSKLLPVAQRLQGVILIHGDALEVLQQYDSVDNCCYIDPPYFPSTRVSPQAYAVEMKAFDHLRLLQVIRNLQGSIVLSGYENTFYSQALSDWDRIEIDVAASSGPTAAGAKKTRRIEVLWVKSSSRF